jgi:replicative DNA helicase
VRVVPARPRLAGAGLRVPPHDLAAEEAVLGAALLSAAARGDALDAGLVASDFYRPAHGHIWAAVVSLDAQAEPVDPVTVADELRREGLLELTGGLGALVALQAGAPSIGGAGRYAGIVAEMATLRRLIDAGQRVAEVGYSLPEDVGTALGQAEAMVLEVGQAKGPDSVVSLAEVLGAGVAAIQERCALGGGVSGLPSGFADLDEVLSGLQPGDLVVLGARPAVGKSALALDVVRHVSFRLGRPVLLFSLEMGPGQLAERFLAAEAKVSLQDLRHGRLGDPEWSRITATAAELGFAPLFVDYRRDIGITEIRAKARRLRARLGDLALVVVDYLQLMRSDAGNRPENRQIEVAGISRGLKVLAGELGVPVLALSSLSRSLEARADKRPNLSDLRESGALEADADVVCFLYRDELYNKDSSERGVAEVIVAKQRNGPTTTVKLAFLAEVAHFASLARR